MSEKRQNKQFSIYISEDELQAINAAVAKRNLANGWAARANMQTLIREMVSDYIKRQGGDLGVAESVKSTYINRSGDDHAKRKMAFHHPIEIANDDKGSK